MRARHGDRPMVRVFRLAGDALPRPHVHLPRLEPEHVVDLVHGRRSQDHARVFEGAVEPQAGAGARVALRDAVPALAGHSRVVADRLEQLDLPRPWLDAEDLAEEARWIVAVVG